MELQLPDKLYFKIGEVAELAGVKPHVLRYWEAEVPAIRPGKNRNQQRLYSRRDIELIFRLKQLLYSQGYTIAGARKALRRKAVPDDAAAAVAPAVPAPAPAEPVAPPVEAAPLPPLPPGQLDLPLGGGIDRRLLAEIRSDLRRLRDSLTATP